MTQARGLDQVRFLSQIKNSLTLHSQRRGPSAKPEKSRLFSRQSLFKSLKSFPFLSVGQFEEIEDNGCWPTKVVLPVTMMP